jgi:bacteriorhodopsin
MTVNGRTADIHITRRGSDWYYTVSAMMGLTSLAIIFFSLLKPRRERMIYYITAPIPLVACIAYWTMGSNLGFTPIAVEFGRGEAILRGNYREIFYVRYIDWFVTTPLLLLSLLLTAGVPWPTLLWVVFVDWVMVVTGLVGALVRSAYKWGYFFVGMSSNRNT